MRIIDQHKRIDYYDGVQRTFGSTDLTYYRKHSEFVGNEAVKNTLVKIPSINQWVFYNVPLTRYTIGFCGKIYPCFICHYDYGSNDTKIHFTLDEIFGFYEHWGNKRKTNFLKGLETRSLKQFYTEFELANQGDLRATFEKHLCPIWIYKHIREPILYINPILRSFEFARIMDPYTAFQEISMFMGAMAFPEKVIPEISNEDKAFAKGFNKFSFRKDKTSETNS